MADLEVSKESIEFTGETLYKIDFQVEICLGRFRDMPEKRIVIKKIYPCNRDERKLLREVAAMYRLDHPSIPKFYGYYWDSKSGYRILCILLEYFQRGDLENEIIKRKETGNPWSEAELLSNFGYLLNAFAYLENSHYAHRDIKPKNIFVADDGSMKVGDFGCSIQSLQHQFMAEATISGSPIYLSPILREAWISYHQGQNLSGKIAHNVYKSDVYSLGLTFLYMVSFKEPMDLATLQHLELKLKSRLKQVKYKSIRWLLRRMLKLKEKERPNFIDLYNFYKQNIEPSQHNLNIYAQSLAHMVNTKSYSSDEFNASILANSKIRFKVKVSNEKFLGYLSSKCGSGTVSSVELNILSLMLENQSISLNLNVYCKVCCHEIHAYQSKIRSKCLCEFWIHEDCAIQRLAIYGSFICDTCNYCVVQPDIAQPKPEIYCPNIKCFGRVRIPKNGNSFRCRECSTDYCNICKVSMPEHENYYCTQVSLNEKFVKCGNCGSTSTRKRGSFYYNCIKCGYLCIVCLKGVFVSHQNCCTEFISNRVLY
ncbi:unnamed protein product [Blepharisma stoltei]|uniref:Protein kinase domain-containing protein n=1 Tax=Blepharisma stoltei TaxID=1481888 RepID=A0AAU9JG26_9CILI|nr:unnamed protein product [Blepharisma stoltei]